MNQYGNSHEGQSQLVNWFHVTPKLDFVQDSSQRPSQLKINEESDATHHLSLLFNLGTGLTLRRHLSATEQTRHTQQCGTLFYGTKLCFEVDQRWRSNQGTPAGNGATRDFLYAPVFQSGFSNWPYLSVQGHGATSVPPHPCFSNFQGSVS